MRNIGPMLSFQTPQNHYLSGSQNVPVAQDGRASYAGSPAPPSVQMHGHYGAGFAASRRSLPGPQYDHLRDRRSVSTLRGMDELVENKLVLLERRLDSHISTTNDALTRLGEELRYVRQRLPGDRGTEDEGVIGALKSRLNGFENELRELGLAQHEPKDKKMAQGPDERYDEMKTAMVALENRLVAAENKANDSDGDDRLPMSLRRVPVQIVKLEADVRAGDEKAEGIQKHLHILEQKVINQQGVKFHPNILERSSSLPTKRPFEQDNDPSRRRTRAFSSSLGAIEVDGMLNELDDSTDDDSLRSFFQALKSIDFASESQMRALKSQVDGPGSTSFELPLFRHVYPREAEEIFYLKVGGSLRGQVLPSPRADFDFSADRCSQSPGDENTVKKIGAFECVLTGRNVSTEQDSAVPQYFVPLGEIYRTTIHTQQKSAVRDASVATNFFVFLSVPHKSLWAIYRYETSLKGNSKPRRISFKPEDRLFKRGGSRDAFCLLENVETWKSARKDMLLTPQQITEVFGNATEASKVLLEPLFAIPLYQELKLKIDSKGKEKIS